jgi:hypothetical protein
MSDERALREELSATTRELNSYHDRSTREGRIREQAIHARRKEIMIELGTWEEYQRSVEEEAPLDPDDAGVVPDTSFMRPSPAEEAVKQMMEREDPDEMLKEDGPPTLFDLDDYDDPEPEHYYRED